MTHGSLYVDAKGPDVLSLPHTPKLPKYIHTYGRTSLLPPHTLLQKHTPDRSIATHAHYYNYGTSDYSIHYIYVSRYVQCMYNYMYVHGRMVAKVRNWQHYGSNSCLGVSHWILST